MHAVGQQDRVASSWRVHPHRRTGKPRVAKTVPGPQVAGLGCPSAELSGEDCDVTLRSYDLPGEHYYIGQRVRVTIEAIEEGEG